MDIVNRCDDVICGRPLQDDLTIGSLGFELSNIVGHRLWDGVEIACRLRAIHLVGIINHDRGIIACPRKPAAGRGRIHAIVSVLIGRGNRDADRVVCKLTNIDAGKFRRNVIARTGRRVLDHLG